jgi:cell division protein ZapE
VREVFFRLTDYPPEDAAHVPSIDLDVGGGRLLHVPKSLKGVAVFSFKKLCGEARARRIIWPSRGITTPSFWSVSSAWAPKCAMKPPAS